MQHLKNIIFDFGGVLIDWNPVYLYKDVFKTEAEMNHFLENVCRYDWNIRQDAGRPLAEATAEKQAEFPEYKDEIAMYYGRWAEMLGGEIVENTRLVKPLSEKYDIYGLTNWSAETIPTAMERYDFFKHLKGIVVSGEEKIVKPDPRLYQILLDRYGLKAEESLFIDDNLSNVCAAEKMGFQVVHCVQGSDLEKTLRDKGVW